MQFYVIRNFLPISSFPQKMKYPSVLIQLFHRKFFSIIVQKARRLTNQNFKINEKRHVILVTIGTYTKYSWCI